MDQTINRRNLIKTSAAAGTIAALSSPYLAHAQTANNDTIKVGLIGAGGRGSGAISQALKADDNTVLWAIGDAFEAPVNRCLENLGAFEKRAEVPAERRFVGIDAYQKVIDSGVDVVLLTSAPGFRPKHIAAAVEAGVHMFIEKPMAVDPAGLRWVRESVKKAKEKNLCIQHGFCWRYHPAVKEAYGKINSGEMGKVKAVYGTYLGGPVRPLPNNAKKPEGMSQVEWEVANWVNFDYLGGGPLLEQAIHTTDKVSWAMGDIAPVSAIGTGGKVGRSDPGNVFDHTNVTYEYPNQIFAHVSQRQIEGAFAEVVDRVTLEKGTIFAPGRCYARDLDGKVTWRYETKPDESQDMYQIEHDQLFAALRKGEVLNGGDHMLHSTAHCLLGALAAHSGKKITWEELWESPLDLAPDDVDFNSDYKSKPMPVPGRFSISK